MTKTITFMQGDCLELMADMPAESVQLILTSPPYNLNKAYEKKTSLSAYLTWQQSVIREMVRLVKPGGSICYQVGNYIEKGEVFPLDVLLYDFFKQAGLKLRNRIVWTFEHGLHCTNRLSGRHETILWFTKGDKYQFALDPIRVPQKYPGKKFYKGPNKGQLSGNPLGKNPGDVWAIPNVKHNHPEKTAHPCQFPEELVKRLISSLTERGQVVLDPFAGSGTTGAVAHKLGRHFIGMEKDAEYIRIASDRIPAMGFISSPIADSITASMVSCKCFDDTSRNLCMSKRNCVRSTAQTAI